MPDDAAKLLQDSRDPKELLRVALALARSTQAPDHRLLLTNLTSADFLSRLDSAADYRAAPADRLRVSRVIHALAANTAPPSRDTLVALTASPVFLKEDERIAALIGATAVVRPPPPPLIAFWDQHSQPDDGYTPTTISALVDNGSPEALKLFEKKLTTPGHEEDLKIAWMRSRILSRRNDEPLLDSCQRLLAGPLPANLKPLLVEVLFDYRPGEWYRPATVTLPPDRRLASPAAIARLRAIAQFALRDLTLTDQQRKAVEGTLKQLEESR